MNRNVFRLAIAVLVASVSAQFAGCRKSGEASSASASSVAREKQSQRAPARLLGCPTLGSTAVIDSPDANIGHRVTLGWKASAAPDSKHGAAVGYCIYRSTKAHSAPMEQVNSQPFRGITCVDDIVESGKKYYYVVRAISVAGALSDESTSATALIPKTPPNPTMVRRDAEPLCRLPDNLK